MRFPKILIAGAAALALLSGCGGNDVAQGGLNQVVLSAIDATSEAKTSKSTISVTVGGVKDQTQPITIVTDGAFNYETQQGSFVVQIPAIEGQPATTSKMVTDKSIVYTEIPPAVAARYGGKTWVRTDAARAGDSVGVDLGSISNSGNPSSGLDMLRAVSTDVTEVGDEKVRDADTTHYRLLLDFNKAASTEVDATRKQSFTSLASIYANRPVPAEVWIDDDDRIRKMTYTVDLAMLQVPTTAPEQKQTGTMTFVIEYFDFGTDVDVQVPPADQVVDAAALQGQQSAT